MLKLAMREWQCGVAVRCTHSMCKVLRRACLKEVCPVNFTVLSMLAHTFRSVITAPYASMANGTTDISCMHVRRGDRHAVVYLLAF